MGATGPAGSNGSDGAVGATGPAGSNGSDGAVGATGPAGSKGEKGEVGSFDTSSDLSLTSRLYVTGDVSLNGGLYVAGDLSWNPTNVPTDALNPSALVGVNVNSTTFTNPGLTFTPDILFNKKTVTVQDASFNTQVSIGGFIKQF